MFPRSPMFMASLYVHHFISSYICNFIRFYSFFCIASTTTTMCVTPFCATGFFLPQVTCPEVPSTVGAVGSQGSGGGGV